MPLSIFNPLRLDCMHSEDQHACLEYLSWAESRTESARWGADVLLSSKWLSYQFFGLHMWFIHTAVYYCVRKGLMRCLWSWRLTPDKWLDSPEIFFPLDHTRPHCNHAPRMSLRSSLLLLTSMLGFFVTVASYSLKIQTWWWCLP